MYANTHTHTPQNTHVYSDCAPPSQYTSSIAFWRVVWSKLRGTDWCLYDLSSLGEGLFDGRRPIDRGSVLVPRQTLTELDSCDGRMSPQTSNLTFTTTSQSKQYWFPHQVFVTKCSGSLNVGRSCGMKRSSPSHAAGHANQRSRPRTEMRCYRTGGVMTCKWWWLQRE